ncbi:single-stranded DNA-binding protein [Croceitalea sp. MTPC9]|uniref:single-stranded DNA-binding protein n=1 Tax=unclassified Croceitalea TaxID=2632280 RepID=UPI002B39A595|nr:single-stranded DNA-binding protein [Croceitalea sp. MTPC6]GMN18500.1 single-stranded DNA-binding protein [Croceitalea sp. MTPC9]
MNALKNKVQLIGNLGSDPEIKVLENGTKLAKFSLATNDSYKNAKGEKVEETQWHNLVAWGKVAEIVENFTSKGKQIAIEGKLQYNTYETKEGEKRYSAEIKVNEILLLGDK